MRFLLYDYRNYTSSSSSSFVVVLSIFNRLQYNNLARPSASEIKANVINTGASAADWMRATGTIRHQDQSQKASGELDSRRDSLFLLTHNPSPPALCFLITAPMLL